MRHSTTPAARLTKDERERMRDQALADRYAAIALGPHTNARCPLLVCAGCDFDRLLDSDAAHAAALVGLAGRVVDWLVKVGAHDADCDRSAGRETCTCGYSALLADARRWWEGRG